MLLVSFLKLIETIRQILPAVSCFKHFQGFPLIILINNYYNFIIDLKW